MFKNTITTTPFTSDEANDYFTNISGDSWRRDTTFLTTIRALLAPRIADDEEFSLAFGQSNYSDGQLSGISDRNAITSLVSSISGFKNRIVIHNFYNAYEQANNAWMDKVESCFEQYMPGWKRIEKVTVFFRKVFGAHCFVNPETKCSIVFVNNIDIKRMHYLQCGIPAFLPWYFNSADGMTEAEKELIYSLREKTSEKYEECITKIAEKYDFHTARIRKLLNGFESKHERLRVREVSDQINNIIYTLNDLNDRIASYLSQKNDLETQLLGLEMKIAQGSDDNEIMDYFLSHKCLHLVSVSDTTMRFVVKATLDYFNEDQASRVIDNNRSYIYDRCNDRITEDDMRMLMKAIFVTQELKMQFCAAYDFRLDGNVRPNSNFGFGAEYNTYMPNPHIDQYNCLGTYLSIINNLLQEHNYIGALEQAIASCKSLNFGDSTVMREFINNVFGVNGKNNRCILLPDGSVVKPEKAIEWLKAQQAEPVTEEMTEEAS